MGWFFFVTVVLQEIQLQILLAWSQQEIYIFIHLISFSGSRWGAQRHDYTEVCRVFLFFAPAMERPDGDKTTGILPLWLFVGMRCKSSFASSLSLLSVCLCCVVNFCVQVSVCAYMRVCVCMTGAHHAALAQRHNVWQRVSQRSRLLFWVVFFVLFCFVFFPHHASKVFIAPQ